MEPTKDTAPAGRRHRATFLRVPPTSSAQQAGCLREQLWGSRVPSSKAHTKVLRTWQHLGEVKALASLAASLPAVHGCQQVLPWPSSGSSTSSLPPAAPRLHKPPLQDSYLHQVAQQSALQRLRQRGLC